MQNSDFNPSRFSVEYLKQGEVYSITLQPHNLINGLTFIRRENEFLFFEGDSRTRERILYLSACYISGGIPAEHIIVH